MSRPALTDEQRAQGRALGRALQRRRGETSTPRLAADAGVSVDVLRKLEQGAVATPGLFLVARIAAALNATLDELVEEASAQQDEDGT